MREQQPDESKWVRKFRHAFRGVAVGARGQSSFAVHLAAALLVAALAAALRLDALRWSLLLLCIFAVLSAELFNTSLEQLAKAVDEQENARIRDALDIASAAVLTISAGAAAVGATVLLPPLLELFG